MRTMAEFKYAFAFRKGKVECDKITEWEALTHTS